jgi:hypothetical protein
MAIHHAGQRSVSIPDGFGTRDEMRPDRVGVSSRACAMSPFQAISPLRMANCTTSASFLKFALRIML